MGGFILRTSVVAAAVSEILAAIYPLAIIWPRQSGTVPVGGEPTFPSGHPILWACPDETYNRLAYIRGGMPPYTCWLTDAPSGMTVDNWGEINWPAVPASPTTVTPTLHVRDAHNTEVTSAWTITVDATKFVWLSGSGADGNAGTKASPWRNLSRIHGGSGVDGGKIAILRTGTYDFNGLYTSTIVARTVEGTPTASSFLISGTSNPEGLIMAFSNGPNAIATIGRAKLVEGNTGGVEGGNHRVNAWHDGAWPSSPNAGDIVGVGHWSEVEFRSSAGTDHCVKWIGYEGETATIDFNFVAANTDWGAQFLWWGSATNPVYIDNLTFVNSFIKASELTDGVANYQQFRRITPSATCPRYTGDGLNPGVFMQNSAGQSYYSQYDKIQHVGAGSGPLKTYYQVKPQYQRVNCLTQQFGWDLKASQSAFEVKFCKWQGTTHVQAGGLFGNNEEIPVPTTGVVMFCLIDMRDAVDLTALAFDVGQNAAVGEIWALRCTFVGRAQVRNVNAGDGPVHFRHCVIVNEDSGQPNRVFRTGSTDSLIDYLDNLTGAEAAGIVDVDGKLTGSFRTSWLDKRGHEIAGVFS